MHLYPRFRAVLKKLIVRVFAVKHWSLAKRARSFVFTFGLSIQFATASPDTIVVNATVYTVDRARPWVEAFAITDGVISEVGTSHEIKALAGQGTHVIDLDGRFAMPGFHDAHIHPMEGVSLNSFMGCDLIPIIEADPDPETWVEPLKKCNELTFPHDWVLGGGHDNSFLMALDRHPKALLDDAFPDKPAAFMEKSSHSMWVNSLALSRLKIDAESKHPQGGKIFKDPKSREPIGILSDSAGDELMHSALANNPKLQEARFHAVIESQALMSSYGITSAVNARLYWLRGNLIPWQRAADEGLLTVRNIMSLWAYPHLDDDDQIALLQRMYSNDSDSMLRVNKVKFYSDGVPELNSAAVSQPYGYLVHSDAELLGGNYFTQERMARYISELYPVGFGALIHAIGDRGAHEALNAIEFAQRANNDLGVNQNRHYVTHVNWVGEDDYRRFSELNVPADTQMNYIEYEEYQGGAFNYYDELSSGIEDTWSRLLINNVANTMAMPEIISEGGRLVISSDWDVSEIDPLFSIQNATVELKGTQVGGKTLAEKDLLKLAIRAYTLNAAYAMNQEMLTGSISVGKFADFIVIDRNLLTVPVETVREARVEQTYVAGELVYEASH